MRKYNIRVDFLEFEQPELTNSLNHLREVSESFRQERLNHEWGKEIDFKTHLIPSSEGHEIEVIEISPKRLKSDEKLPLIFYCHGGGFFSTYTIGQLQFAERYCLGVGCKLIFVKYRLSTEHPFPAGFNDCYDSFQWMISNATELKIDLDRILMLGDSAGGGLTAGVVQRVFDEGLAHIKAQFLVYPALDSRGVTDSAKNFVDTPIWTANNNKIMWEVYLRGIDKLKGTPNENLIGYASPATRDNLQGLPKTYIQIAEFDPVRDEAIAYAKCLLDAGVNVEYEVVKGAMHAFDFVDCDFNNTIIQHRILKMIELLH